MIARHRLSQSVASIVCGLSVLIATEARGQEVLDTSYIAPDGSRVLQQSIVVPATARQVWDAVTTTEGMRSWAVPVVQVDFRPGGIWESAYSLDARIGAPGNIKNRILSFLPLRMLSFQVVAAPPGFARAELLPDIVTVIELDELDPSSVRVTESMVGYKPGEGYDTLYSFFQAGNAWSLKKLHQRFIEGPIDWQKTLRRTRQ